VNRKEFREQFAKLGVKVEFESVDWYEALQDETNSCYYDITFTFPDGVKVQIEEGSQTGVMRLLDLGYPCGRVECEPARILNGVMDAFEHWGRTGEQQDARHIQIARRVTEQEAYFLSHSLGQYLDRMEGEEPELSLDNEDMGRFVLSRMEARLRHKIKEG